MASMVKFSRSFSTRGSFSTHEWVANVNKLTDISRDPVKSTTVPFVQIRPQKSFVLDTFKGFAGAFSPENWLLQGALSITSFLFNKPPSFHTPHILFCNLTTDGFTLKIRLGEAKKENISVLMNKSTLLVSVVMLGVESEANILYYHILLPSHNYKHSNVKAAFIHGVLMVRFTNTKGKEAERVGFHVEIIGQ